MGRSGAKKFPFALRAASVLWKSFPISLCPLGEGLYRVHVVVKFVGVGVFLPATATALRSTLVRASVVVDGIQAVVQGLKSQTLELVRAGGLGVHREDRAVSGENAAPGIAVMGLFTADQHAVANTGESAVGEGDEGLGIFLPIRIE